LIDLSQRLNTQELIAHLNSHLETRMFVVGHSITAADIALLA
jgi:glutathione S-transferase